LDILPTSNLPGPILSNKTSLIISQYLSTTTLPSYEMLSKVVPNANVPIDINPLFSSYLFMNSRTQERKDDIFSPSVYAQHDPSVSIRNEKVRMWYKRINVIQML
jgi:hypothetical protein